MELKHTETDGMVEVWVFDAHHGAMTIEKAPVLNVPGDKPKQLTATGKGAEWVFKDDALTKHVHGLALRIEIDGKTYNQEWDPGH